MGNYSHSLIWLIKVSLQVISMEMHMLYVLGQELEETVSLVNLMLKIWDCTVIDWDALVMFVQLKKKHKKFPLVQKNSVDLLGVILLNLVLKLQEEFYQIPLIKLNILKRLELCLIELYK